MRTKASGKKESYAGVLITQGKYRFYSAALPIEALASTCFVTTREEDPKAGFQRLLDEKRADQIAQYIDHEGTIPTSVILSAQEDSEFHYNPRKKTISFKSVEKAFLVLDGQHRVWGFRKATTNLRVPVVIYSGLSRLEESRLFIDINTKQRPVSNELLLDIKKLADYESEAEQYLGNLFDLFSTKKDSSLKGLTSPAKRVKGLISRVTFYRAIKPILPRITDNDEAKLFPVLNAYLKAVTWGLKDRKVANTLTSPIVFGAFMHLFPDVAVILSDKHGKDELSPDRFGEILEPVFSGVKLSHLKSPGNSAKQLGEELSKLLRGQKLKL